MLSSQDERLVRALERIATALEARAATAVPSCAFQAAGDPPRNPHDHSFPASWGDGWGTTTGGYLPVRRNAGLA